MRWAICNEILDDRPLAAAFDAFAEVGYAGLELAPYTLGLDLSAPEPAAVARVRRAAQASGLEILGLHWLLARTTGLHVAVPELAEATLARLGTLTRLCADLGGRVLVFGSPNQRSTPAGMRPPTARNLALELFGRWAEIAADAGVTICLEPLPRAETDFMNTIGEVIGILDQLGHDSVRLVLDVKSMADEGAPMTELIRLAAPRLAHVQANDADRGGPGFGDTDFVPILATLAEFGYDGWVSVEAFDYSPGRMTVVTGSLATLQAAHQRTLHAR